VVRKVILYLVHVLGHFPYVELVDDGDVGQPLYSYRPAAPLDDRPGHILRRAVREEGDVLCVSDSIDMS
jgi:hypothetical protein